MVLAFAAMTSVQAAGLNNNTYEYATVFIPNGGPVFVYSAVSNNGFHKQRVNIQHLDILSDELGVAVPKGLAPDLDKLDSMLKQVGFKKVSHRIVYTGFEKVRSDNELWQDVVHTKRFKQKNSATHTGTSKDISVWGDRQETKYYEPENVTRHEQAHKTGQRIDLKKGREAGHAYIFKRLAVID